MDNTTEEQNAQETMENQPIEGIPEHDPYPKMIIVCIFISMFLFFIIVVVMMFEFMQRNTQDEIRPQNPAFFEEQMENPPPIRSN